MSKQNEKASKATRVNYTPEQEQALRVGYVPGMPAEEFAALAESVEKSTRSVIAKLSRMGLYVKQGYRNKAGDKPVFKAAIVDAIADQLGLDEASAESLSKANKKALAAIAAAIGAEVASE